MFSAKMGGKFFIAQLLVFLLHFLERPAVG
jgi:hypothetical protein